MRLPVSSETDAFRAVLVLLAAIGVSLALGYAIGAGAASPILGATLFCVGILGAVWWAFTLVPADSPVHDAEAEGERAGGERRILFIAGEAPSTEQLKVLRAADPEAHLDVHAPVLQSRTHFVTTDIDRETELARRRLHITLELAAKAGIQASGEVGDPIDPLAGIEDQLRRRHVDEIVLATHPLADANWVEMELLDQL